MINIRVGARDSRLSRIQVKEVFDALFQVIPQVKFSSQFVQTTGDLDCKTSLRKMEKTDFFTREIDTLVREGHCQIGIHSAKDLPDPLPDGLAIVAITAGIDAGDSLVLPPEVPFYDLPANPRIGTSSLRREQIIHQIYPDAHVFDIRGTIEERLSLLDCEVLDGIVVAEAALIRLGLCDRNRVRLPGATSPLQGKLAVIAKAGDVQMAELFAPLDTR